MILTVRSPSKSVGFKSLKDTYQKIGHQCKKASIEVKGVTAKDLYRQAMDERTYRVLLDARQRPGKIGGTCPDEQLTTPALAYDKRLNNELKQHTRTVRAC
jgi:hypothetical protein